MIIEIDSSEIIIYLSEKRRTRETKSRRIAVSKLEMMRRKIEDHDSSVRVVLGSASYERFLRFCDNDNVRLSSENFIIKENRNSKTQSVFRQLGPSNANKIMFSELGF